MNIRCFFQKLLDGDVEAIVQAYDKRPWDGYYLKIILKRKFPTRREASEWYEKHSEEIRKVMTQLPK